jgi:GPI-anchor transamidase subunit GAA1
VTVYDHYSRGEFPDRDLSAIPWWVPSAFKHTEAVQEYAYRAQNILRHVDYQARGQASGVHGLMHQYVYQHDCEIRLLTLLWLDRFRIDAFTLFAIPAHGPHGFHAIGR